MPNMLTQKLGPLPAWGWGAIVGGGVLGYRLIFKRESNDPEVIPSTEDIYVPTQTSRSPTSYMPFSAPPDTVALDEAREQAVTETLDLLDPRITSLESLIAGYEDSLDEARNDYAMTRQELAAWQIAATQWFTATDTLSKSVEGYVAGVNDRLDAVNQALATPREPNPNPHTAPVPPSPAKATPNQGDHVWKGQSPPNMTVIRNLLINRYGKVVPTRVTRPGTGGYLVVVS